jgi:hypothetical protein
VFRIPGKKETSPVALCKLEDLGDLGPDRARTHEGFRVTTTDWTPYAALWGHESDKVRTIGQSPNVHLTARLDSPRGPDYGPHLWERAGCILLVERMRLNRTSQHATARLM